MKQAPINIGLFGGTFDPIHAGHLIVAERLRTSCQMDHIWFIPAKIHALKENNDISDAAHRLEMVRLAIAENPDFSASDMEISREGVSYTVDTLRQFRQDYPPPAYALHFFLGSDNVNQFHQWKSPRTLLSLCHFIAFGREGMDVSSESPFADAFDYVAVPQLEISATDIRRRAQQGESIRYLVPESVRQYILTHQLYQ
jgi:nicotinate-nucleotide adenylyltransferase